jgi:hypothetical protein
MSEEFTLTYQLTRKDMMRGGKVLWNSLYPGWWRILGYGNQAILGMGMFVLALIIATLIWKDIATFYIRHQLTILFLGIAFCVLYRTACLQGMRAARKMIEGYQHVTEFSENGVRTRFDGVLLDIPWLKVQDIRSGKGMIVVRYGATGLLIPERCIEGDVGAVLVKIVGFWEATR